MFYSYLFWTSGLWTYQPGSQRRKVTDDFSSTFLLRCLPQFFSRDGFNLSFLSSTLKLNFVYYLTNRSPLVGLFFFFFFFARKNPSYQDSNSRPNVRWFRGYQLNHRGDWYTCRNTSMNLGVEGRCETLTCGPLKFGVLLATNPARPSRLRPS